MYPCVELHLASCSLATDRRHSCRGSTPTLFHHLFYLILPVGLHEQVMLLCICRSVQRCLAVQSLSRSCCVTGRTHRGTKVVCHRRRGKTLYVSLMNSLQPLTVSQSVMLSNSNKSSLGGNACYFLFVLLTSLK